jgi:hypothetical protein
VGCSNITIGKPHEYFDPTACGATIIKFLIRKKNKALDLNKYLS